jgi:valyl-tRNA synthetase
MAGYRRFCNKIYQATKYCLGSFEKYGNDFTPRDTAAKGGNESLSERWILSKLNKATQGVNDAMAAREFSRSTQIREWALVDMAVNILITCSLQFLL